MKVVGNNELILCALRVRAAREKLTGVRRRVLDSRSIVDHLIEENEALAAVALALTDLAELLVVRSGVSADILLGRLEFNLEDNTVAPVAPAAPAAAEAK